MENRLLLSNSRVRGVGMSHEEDIASIRQFHNALKPHGIKTWNSSESLPEEVLQQLVSEEEMDFGNPRAEELHPQQDVSHEGGLSKGSPRLKIAHFVDGSPRTVNTGFLLGANGIPYPVALSHVGAASATFDKGRWRETGFADKSLILIAHNKMGIPIEIGGKWQLEDPTDRLNREINVTNLVELRGAAVRRARRRMRNCEKDLVRKLADNFPEEWIALDGTLFEIEGPSELKDFNVIGISKSFTLNPIVMKGSSTQERLGLGYLVDLLTKLQVGLRSPVYKLTPHMDHPEKYTYMWFVRIHAARQSPTSGVVKVELPPADRYLDFDLRVRTIDAVSHAIFRLRTPYLYDNRRGESFLYPIHVAETCVKSKLNSVEKLRGIWESSQY